MTGRYYAMDRDNRWERVKRAYDALTEGIGKHTADPAAALQESYDAGVTDEFVEPIVVTGEGRTAADDREERRFRNLL